ncbi:MAG: FG-GAP-like repeat-containing protein [Pirellulales bacterium]
MNQSSACRSLGRRIAERASQCVAVLVLLAAIGCGAADSDPQQGAGASSDDVGARYSSEEISWREFSPAASGERGAESGGFTPIAADSSGVGFVAPIDKQHPLRFLYHSGFMAGGVAIGDLDGDGRNDLFIAGGPVPNKLYRQTDAWKFEDITASAGVGGNDWAVGAALVDIDADGDLDIYVCNYERPNQLFVNDGQAHFTEQAARFGLDLIDASLMPTFCDYDRDGDLDVFVLTNRVYYPDGLPSGDIIEYRKVPAVKQPYDRYFGIVSVGKDRPTLRPVGRPDYMLRNDNGRFTDVSGAAGIRDGKHDLGFGLSATWWDYDQDGWTDLYVANDMNDPDKLYRNNRDGTFTDVIADVLPHTSQFSMGADFGDLDNDGRFDFLVADMSATTHFMQKTTMGAMGAGRPEIESYASRQMMRNALYVNTGTQRFAEAAYLAGLADTDWTWTIKFADFDNDGRLDVYATNGMTRSFNDSDVVAPRRTLNTQSEFDAFKELPKRPEQNLAFRNRGEFKFDDASKAWKLDHTGVSGPSAHGDLDGDGDLDLVVVNLDEPVSLYRNDNRSDNRGDAGGGHRVMFSLRGRSGNRFGVGARLKLETGSGVQVRQLIPNTGFLGGNEPAVHFGLGDSAQIDRVTIDWPSGRKQEFERLPANRHYTVFEPDTSPPSYDSLRAPQTPGKTWFTRSDAARGIVHVEQPFDDFKRQPLLPNQLSQLGPGLACGDVDGDGDDDIFVGGAHGLSGKLYVNEGPSVLYRAQINAWTADAQCEDMGALFFDADSDGDLDLYVVSGGVECEPGDAVLRDRLYLNDGSGQFTKDAADALPDLRDSGSVVAAADYDGDGDLDLFVGSRVVPGQYPLSPPSRLLRNDGGKFVDASAEVAPSLATAGMVTSAVWSDADNDGRVDLFVTSEWGSLRLLVNENGRLVDRTKEAGLASRTGWYNGIAASDVDNDGDMDYIVTNFGLNTKYHAGAEKPALLYYGDFDGSGSMQLVEAGFEHDSLFPIRGRSCSSRAMPFIRDKFATYKDFALASLDDIYTDKCLEDAKRFEATSLESGVWMNAGLGPRVTGASQFEFVPLPRIAQISPSFGVVAAEFNGDGKPDLYLAQNFYTPQWETGRMDSGVGLLLTGNGDGTFTPVSPSESGLVVPGDAKSATAADLNADGRPDIVVGVNDGELSAWQRGASDSTSADVLAVRLKGPSGNPTGVGARITVTDDSGRSQTGEIHAGGGYLSQSAAVAWFGAGGAKPARIEVHWPDGTTTSLSGSEALSTSHGGAILIERR